MISMTFWANARIFSTNYFFGQLFSDGGSTKTVCMYSMMYAYMNMQYAVWIGRARIAYWSTPYYCTVTLEVYKYQEYSQTYKRAKIFKPWPRAIKRNGHQIPCTRIHVSSIQHPSRWMEHLHSSSPQFSFITLHRNT